jgi:hypothetical protein
MMPKPNNASLLMMLMNRLADNTHGERREREREREKEKEKEKGIEPMCICNAYANDIELCESDVSAR